MGSYHWVGIFQEIDKSQAPHKVVPDLGYGVPKEPYLHTRLSSSDTKVNNLGHTKVDHQGANLQVTTIYGFYLWARGARDLVVAKRGSIFTRCQNVLGAVLVIARVRGGNTLDIQRSVSRHPLLHLVPCPWFPENSLNPNGSAHPSSQT